MPVSDPSSGRMFLWIIAGLLFISVAAGGACLVAYLLLPESETSSSWIPEIGVGLVCLPWLFWLLTFIYRTLSRIFGWRVSFGGGSVGNWVPAANANVEVAVASHAKGGDHVLLHTKVKCHWKNLWQHDGLHGSVLMAFTYFLILASYFCRFFPLL